MFVGQHWYSFGAFRLEVGERRLLRGGHTVPLRSRSFDTLLALVENSGRLLERDELMRLIWPDSTVDDSNLTQNISVLRKILGTETEGTPYIVTVPGKGYRFVARVEAALEGSIAVLPIANLSSDPELDFFCDGLAEEIIDALAQVKGLRVIGRASSANVGLKGLDDSEIGNKLGVATLVEGSVRKSEGRLRIAVRLTRASTGFQLWSEHYDRELGDAFAIHDDIVTAIVAHVRKTILGRRTPSRLKRPTENREVYQLYLEARYQFAREFRHLERAVELLERALELEPDFAHGLALLGLALTDLCHYGLAPFEDTLPRAEDAVSRALELDDSLPGAHRALGIIRSTFYWDWPGAHLAIERARQLDPGAARVHLAYAIFCLAPVGRLEEAEREMRIAVDLDPLAPRCSRAFAQVLFFSRQYDAAIGQLRHTLEFETDFPATRNLLATVYTAMGRPDDAIHERQIHLQRRGQPEQAEEMGRIYTSEGEEGVFRWLAKKQLLRLKAGKAHPYGLALLYAWLDEREPALEWLEEAFARKGSLTLWTKVHPWLDNLHGEHRFEALLDRLGVNPSQNPNQ